MLLHIPKTRIICYTYLLLVVTLAACSPTAQPTATPVPTTLPSPTSTSLPPTVTQTLPTSTILPTVTSGATNCEQIGQFVSSSPRGIIVSNDGQWLAVLSDSAVQLVKADDPAESRSFSVPEDSVLLDFSSDGHTLAAGRDNAQIDLIDVTSGHVALTLTPTRLFLAARFTSDGKALVLSEEDLSAELWNASSGQLLKTFSGFETAAPVFSVIPGVDGRTWIWISRAKVQLMNTTTGKLSPEFRHEDFVSAVALSPDGRILATAASGTVNNQIVPLVKLWDAASGQELVVLPQSEYVTSMTFSPDGQGLAIAAGKDIFLWNIAQQKLVGTCSGHTDQINAIALSPDGATAFSASVDNTVRLWRTHFQ